MSEHQYILLELGYETNLSNSRVYVPAVCNVQNSDFNETQVSGNSLDVVQQIADILLVDDDFKDYSLVFHDIGVVLKHHVLKADIAINLVNIIDENKATELEELLGLKIFSNIEPI